VDEILLNTEINAPAEICFDLSRSIDLHLLSTASSKERAIAGVTTGLIGLDETVTWKARHFGIWFELTSTIIELEFPRLFTDKMVRGPFKSIEHVHRFTNNGDHTSMEDSFRFEAPFGVLGRITSKLILTTYLRKLLNSRNEMIKEYAESEKWKTLLKNK